MIKFIHAADIHLDSALKGLQQYEGAPVERVRGATRRALENLVRLAVDQQANFVVIAGDVYDGDWKDHNTGLFFVRQMSLLRDAGIPVIVISGNHDAANRMTKSLRLPDNVERLSHNRAETAVTPKLRELGVAVHGRSFRRQAETDNLACDYPAAQKGMLNIGLLHTSLGGAEGHEPYAPCSIDDLRNKGYDYWALGHVHTRTTVCTEPYAVFSGNTQGRHIREAGAKGCYLVTIDGSDGIEQSFEPLDVYRWELCELDAGDARQPEDLLDPLRNRLLKLSRTHGGMPLAVRVVVRGATRAHEKLVADPLPWTAEVRAVALDACDGSIWIEKVQLQTGPAHRLDEAALSDGPMGVLLRYVEDLRGNDAELLKLSGHLDDLRSKLPHEVLSGDDPLALEDPQFLRSMLGSIEPLLISRLLEGMSEPGGDA